MEAIVPLLIVLILARAFGSVAKRLGHAASVGELLAGIALAVLALAAGSHLAVLQDIGDLPALDHLADLGVFFLLLMAGVELKPRQIAQNSAGSLLVAFGGMLAPLAAGCALGWFIIPDGELKLAQTLVVGVAMSITAVPATIEVLDEFDLLNKRLGEVIIAAALFDDVFALILLAVVTAVIETGGTPDLASMAFLLSKIAVFFAVTALIGSHIYPRLNQWLDEDRAVATEFGALVMAALFYGAIAEWLGMHWILGAFMAGLYFEPTRVGDLAYRDIKLLIHALTASLLSPFFFVSIGLDVEIGVLLQAPLLVIAMTLIAFAGKLVGSGGSARLIGLHGNDALAVGVGMTSRGAVELIILGVALNAGVFAQSASDGNGSASPFFSALIFMAIANTLAMPILLRAILRQRPTETAKD